MKHKLQPVVKTSANFKKRFLLRKGQSLAILPVADILLIRAVNGVLLATDTQQQVHILSETNLGDIESQLDPAEFFRINRSDLLHINSIVRVDPYNKETVSVRVNCDQSAILSSKTRTAAFRKWLNQ
jgi:DNA-binding LytR/AlgR family response regulator